MLEAHLYGQDDEEKLCLRTALNLIENEVSNKIGQDHLRVHVALS